MQFVKKIPPNMNHLNVLPYISETIDSTYFSPSNTAEKDH